jgi:hypothetical protein
MQGFARFMAGNTGRIIRAVAGIVLIVLGLFVIEDVAGYIVAAVGLIPLAAGVFDFCLLTPLVGMPFRGEDVRNQTG